MKTNTIYTSGFRGRHETANYRDTGIKRHQHNPLIEALPQIPEEAEVMHQLRKLPAYDPSERTLPNGTRLQLIQTLRDVYIPLPTTMDLYQRFSAMIRTGYISKNPLARGYWPNLDAKIEETVTEAGINRSAQSNAAGMAIFGIPGAGKSSTVENILSLYPQVIMHSSYAGQAMPLTQIVYLKLDCPHDASTKGLCLNFLQAVDEIVGTNNAERYSSRRCTVYDLLRAMSRVAAVNNLGLLAIDEIQQLEQAKSGGKRMMLNFFCHLMNSIALPVILIGTYEAQAVLNDEFRQIRRNCGNGDFVWDRMQNDEIWKYLVECLWPYQYTKQFSPCTPELRNALYDTSQGVTDFCVKIYMASQARAILSGLEEITPEIIRSVFHDSFRSAHGAMRALKMQDASALHQFNDLAAMNTLGGPPNINTTAVMTSPKPPKKTTASQAGGEPPPSPVSKTVKPSPKVVKPQPTGLVAAAADSLEKKSGVYTSLQAAGFISNASEFLEEVPL